MRLAGHIAEAEAIGAAAVLVTCSTVSLSVDAVRPHARVPIVTIDEAMAREAVSIGRRIVVIATNPTTVEPSRALLAAAASTAGLNVEISVRVVDGALAALQTRDGDRHDQLVAGAIREEEEQADVVVLAQASTARVLRAMGRRSERAPLLASPYLALEQVGRILGVQTFGRPGAAQHEVGL